MNGEIVYTYGSYILYPRHDNNTYVFQRLSGKTKLANQLPNTILREYTYYDSDRKMQRGGDYWFIVHDIRSAINTYFNNNSYDPDYLRNFKYEKKSIQGHGSFHDYHLDITIQMVSPTYIRTQRYGQSYDSAYEIGCGEYIKQDGKTTAVGSPSWYLNSWWADSNLGAAYPIYVRDIYTNTYSNLAYVCNDSRFPVITYDSGTNKCIYGTKNSDDGWWECDGVLPISGDATFKFVKKADSTIDSKADLNFKWKGYTASIGKFKEHKMYIGEVAKWL